MKKTIMICIVAIFALVGFSCNSREKEEQEKEGVEKVKADNLAGVWILYDKTAGTPTGKVVLKSTQLVKSDVIITTPDGDGSHYTVVGVSNTGNKPVLSKEIVMKLDSKGAPESFRTDQECLLVDADRFLRFSSSEEPISFDLGVRKKGGGTTKDSWVIVGKYIRVPGVKTIPEWSLHAKELDEKWGFDESE